MYHHHHNHPQPHHPLNPSNSSTHSSNTSSPSHATSHPHYLDLETPQHHLPPSTNSIPNQIATNQPDNDHATLNFVINSLHLDSYSFLPTPFNSLVSSPNHNPFNVANPNPTHIPQPNQQFFPLRNPSDTFIMRPPRLPPKSSVKVDLVWWL